MSYSPATRTAGAPLRGTGPGRPGLIGGLGRACYRHRWLTLLAWLGGVACLITLFISYGAPAQDNYTGSDPGQALLNQHFPRQSGDTLTLAIESASPITSPAVRARVTDALAPFARAPHVSAVTSPYQAPGQISRDGHIAFATIQFGVPSTKISNGEALALMHDARVASGHGVTFSLGGDVVDLAETPYGGPTDGIGVLAAAVVLLIAFGSFLAMGLPVATALLGIGGGLSVIALLGHVVPAPSFSPIIAAMIGLGVGVDYALFIVTRFREALHAGAAPEAAAVKAMRTAGKTVLIAGTTVVIGMLGLLVLRQPLLDGVAVAAAATVAMVLLGSLTLLPALLGFTGSRLARPGILRLPGRRHRPRANRSAAPVAERWAGVIQRHPVTAAAMSAGIILALAAPALALKLNFPDESSQPRGSMGYASYATMAKGFGPGFDAPLIVAARLPSPAASTAGLAAAIRHTPGVAAVTPPVVSRDGAAVMMAAYPTTGEQDTATTSRAGEPDPGRCAVARHRRHRASAPTSRAQRRRRGVRQPRLAAPAPVHGDRGGGRAVHAAPDGGVPLGRRPAQGGGDEPAVDRGGVRRARRHRVQWGWLGHASHGLGAGAHRALGADDAVRHPVRPVHGLRGVPALADPRELRRHRGQRHLGRPRAGPPRG